jgi:hypothetical protein
VVGCAQDDGVHAKHGHMLAESRLMRHPTAMAHDKRRCGRSTQPLLESRGRTSPGGLALATGLQGGPHKDGLERLLGRYVRESEWARV